MTSAKSQAKRTANKLLELHLQHELNAFDERAFLSWFEDVCPQLFEAATKIRVRDVLSADRIKALIQRNVVNLEIPGSIAEIAGEASTLVFSSKFHLNTRLQDILSTAQYEEIVDKLLELKEQRRTILNQLIELPVYQDLISGVLYQAMVRYIYESNAVSKHVPGVASMMKFGKNMMQKAMPKLESALEESIRSYIAGNLNFLLKESRDFLENSLTDEELKGSAMELWDHLEDTTLRELQQGMNSIDLSEFVVLGYEFWLRFRTTPYFKQAYEAVVDYLFEKFGQETVAALLEELQITPDRVKQEVRIFAPDILQSLQHSGVLEMLIRGRLERFYHSDAALKCLQSVQAPPKKAPQ